MSNLVSIIIPTYNAAAFLPDALNSALAQTHRPIEILVVDDGSTDETRHITRRYADSHPEIRLIEQPNGGPARARNTGIAAAQGDFMQFLDADDALLPEKIARCLAVFEGNPSAGLVYSDFEIRGPDLITPDLAAEKPIIPLDDDRKLVQILVENTSSPFRVPCALVRADAVRRVGGFGTGFDGVEDWHFWIKLAASGVIFRPLPEILVLYRQVPSGLSKNPVKMAQSRLGAMLALGELNLPPELDLARKISGRYHALAMESWSRGDRAAARQALRKAYPNGAKGWLLWGMTFILSGRMANGLIENAVSMKRVF